MDQFIEHLSGAVVNDQIFPSIVTGFMDSNPVVREHTIKVGLHSFKYISLVLYFTMKLVSSNINNNQIVTIQWLETNQGIKHASEYLEGSTPIT